MKFMLKCAHCGDMFATLAEAAAHDGGDAGPTRDLSPVARYMAGLHGDGGEYSVIRTVSEDCPLAIGRPTGRWFIYDDYNTKLVRDEPDHDEWHRWEEYREADGDLWYVSDHEDYTLGADEFGPIEPSTMGFHVGDEWSDSVGNYIIIAVDDEAETVTTHDWEGVIDVQSANEWLETIIDMPLEPVTEPSVNERLAAWCSNYPDFPNPL